MTTRERIIDGLVTHLATCIVELPLYVIVVIVAGKYESYRWEIILGYDFLAIMVELNLKKGE